MRINENCKKTSCWIIGFTLAVYGIYKFRQQTYMKRHGYHPDMQADFINIKKE